MAKVTNVNINCSSSGTRQGSQILFDLKTMLLANGWSITATSDSTNFTNGSSPDNISTVALFDVSSAYYVLADPSGTCWIYVQRQGSNTTFTVKVSRVAPQSNGTATVMPTCSTASDETTLVNNTTLFNSSANARGHIITYDAAENAAGVRPFYLFMTDGTSTMLGSFIVEAIADNTYDTSNSYPWVTSAGSAISGLDYIGNKLTYYYSPTSTYVTTNWSYPVYFDGVYISNNTQVSNPWSGTDTAVPVLIGKGVSRNPLNVLGFLKNIFLPQYYRNYPNTFTTAEGERYVHLVYFIIPYENGTTPL